jgi:hypothetical protein
MGDKVCFTRYRNNGSPYTICQSEADIQREKDRKNARPPPTPLISPEEFVRNLKPSGYDEDKKGKWGYSKLTQAQKTEYHRLDMANRREEKREFLNKNRDELVLAMKNQRAVKREQKSMERERQKLIGRRQKRLDDAIKEYTEVISKLRRDFQNPRMSENQIHEYYPFIKTQKNSLEKLKKELADAKKKKYRKVYK